jgi:membrane protease YdiL (CAAX protease family)
VYSSFVLSVKGSLALAALSFGAMLTGGALLGGLGLAGVFLAEWLFVAGPPLAWATATGDLRGALALRAPGGRALAGAALVGLTMWIALAYGLLPLQERLSPTPPELEEALEKLVIADGGPWLQLLVLALTPAICEELLFRGVLLPPLARRTGAPIAVVLSAALFALLHLDPHRFLATFLLGVVFGTMTVWSRSTVPAIVAHALSNSCVILLAQPAAEVLNASLEAQRVAAVTLAVGILTIGLGLVRAATKNAPNVS